MVQCRAHIDPYIDHSILQYDVDIKIYLQTKFHIFKKYFIIVLISRKAPLLNGLESFHHVIFIYVKKNSKFLF